MEDTRTETASDVINDLISELAVSQNILDVIFVEKHFFEDNHSSDAQVRGHLNRLNSIIDAYGLKFEAVMDLATKAFDAVAALEKAIPQTEN